MNGLTRHRNPSLASSVLSPFSRLHEELDHAMQDFYNMFESTGTNLKLFENITLSPALDLVEESQCFKVEAEMPGMDEKDIKISADENRLTIEGEKTTSKKDERKNFLSREINYGRYERSIALPQTADIDKATASFKKGILCITIPKKSGTRNTVKTINIEKTK